MVLYAALAGMCLSLGGGILFAKKLDQEQKDHNRKTYRLAFPAELTDEAVVAWLRAISGTLKAPSRYRGVPTVVFEMWATRDGIKHRLKVPWQHADYVVGQLRSLVPGIRVTPEDEFPRRVWVTAVELGLSHTSRQLRIPSAENMSTSLLASMQALEDNETVLMQWVITPAMPVMPPIINQAQTDNFTWRSVLSDNLASKDEVNDRRGKLEQPNVRAILRVGAVANTKDRADHLIYRVRASLASARSARVQFEKRLTTARQLQERLDNASAPLNFPMQLSAYELAALIAWPIGSPFISGLPPMLARQLPAPQQVPTDGRIIGRSNFPGNERLVAISFEDARKHVHVVGPTGVGKTVLLGNMLKQDIEHGYGVVLIESKGDLFHSALNYIPHQRLNDVIVLDVQDTKHPIGFNILQQGDPKVVVDELVALFDHLYSDARGVWTREVLYHGLLTIISDPKFTFVDLAPMLVPMTKEEIEWADNLRRNLKDRELRQFWQRFENQPKPAQDRITQPVMDRIWQLNARPEIRNIIGQSESSFQMTDVVKDNKILLINLSGLAKDTAALVGTLLINSLWHAIKNNHADKPTFLYIDEFQDFMNLPVDAEDMLAKARSFGLGMTLAHQHMGQLPNDMRQAVSANARSKIVFQTTNEDAKAMARDFGTMVTENDFMNLGRFEAVARVATGDGVSPPLTLSTSEPAIGYGLAGQVRHTSRQIYGRPLSEIEEQIIQRRKPEATPRPNRPVIGGEGAWNPASAPKPE